jgi:hypothetical protein
VSKIRVGDSWKNWEDNNCFAFNESCEHEVLVSPSASGQRIVFIIDVANPFLYSYREYVNSIVPPFADAAGEEYNSFWRFRKKEL